MHDQLKVVDEQPKLSNVDSQLVTDSKEVEENSISNWERFLSSTMNEEQIKQLRKALHTEGKEIIIKGSQGPSGKSTLRIVLDELGITAVEEDRCHGIEMNRLIGEIDNGMLLNLLCELNGIRRWIDECPQDDEEIVEGNDVFANLKQAFEEAVEYAVVNSMSGCDVNEIRRSELLTAVANEASRRLKERNVSGQDGLANVITGRKKYQEY